MAAANERVFEQNHAISANGVALGGISAQQIAGARTLLEVLNQQLELLGRRVGLVSAEHDQLASGLQLMAALGTLTTQQLHLNVVPFDPRVHYESVRNKWAGQTPAE